MRSTAWIVRPSIGFLGALALGTTATEKPSLAASFRRSWPRGAGRTSPARPTSPKAMKPRGSARLRIELWMASITARSAAGSLMRTPPTALTNTSWSPVETPACRCNTASSIASRSRSRPTDSRRGLRPPAGVDQGLDLHQHRPRALQRDQHAGARHRLAVRGQEDGARIGHALQAALGHREHADLVDGAEAVLDRTHQPEAGVGVALEIEHAVDDVLEHAGPGEAAVLGDVADQHHGAAARLGGCPCVSCAGAPAPGPPSPAPT